MAKSVAARQPTPAPEARRSTAAPAARPIFVQRFAETHAFRTADESSAMVQSALAEPGARLDPGTRAFMEPRFGQDFSQVRVYADDSAAMAAGALNARAFTFGDHIFFGAGQSATGRSGQRLMAHELTHVTQQRGGAVSSVPGPGGLRVSDPGDASERSAERTADAVMAGRSASMPGMADPAAPAALGARVIQRFLAGDDGHGGIEESALQEAGFSEKEANETDYGNWLRDFSQKMDPAGGNDWVWFHSIIPILAAGKFGRKPTREELGRYLPSEHMDNPEGGESAENPGYTKDDKQDPEVEQKKRVAALSKSQQAWVAESQTNEFKKDINNRSLISGLPEYIERGKVHAMRQIQEAARLGRNSQGFEALGNGLHAIEDYFAHSNFIEVALALLVKKDKVVASDNPSYAASNKYPGVDWSTLGTVNEQTNIITGTSAPGPGDKVGKWEVIKAEFQSGEIRRLLMEGAAIYGWKGGEFVGKGLAHLAGASVGGAVGAVGGGVAGLFTGAARGAAQGWRKSRHWWEKPFAAVGGLLKGAVTGLGRGAAKGAQAGWRIGGKAGDVLGRVLGPVSGFLTAAAAASATLVAEVVISGILAAMRPFASWRMRANTKETYTGKKKTTGYTHSQIAKDDKDHPLHAAAADLAHFVDFQVGRKMIEVWAGRADVKDAVAMVDTYVAHPAKGDWWKARLAAFVNQPKKDAPADPGPGG
jgi:hypothetical protein